MIRENARHSLFYRLLLAVVIIAIAAALRIAPHPWNFTPVGAMALFSGAIIKDRRLAAAFPLLALFTGDIFIGFYKPGMMLLVYASFAFSVFIGRWVQNHSSLGRISAATLLGAIQFFLVTNFAIWALGSSYPHNVAGLGLCYEAGIPFFWNTLAGDAFYAALFFGFFALAERFVPILREPVTTAAR